MREIIIGKNDANQRLDKFLTKRFRTMPQSLLYKYIRKKCVKINNKKCENSTLLKEGDVVKLFIKDEFFENSPIENYEFLKAPDKLDILYEDDNIILMDKKAGVIVHPDKNYHFDSLVARVQHYLYNKGEYDPKNENSFTPALANRIDRNTGGIVMACKNAESLRALNEKIKNREIRKLYLCMVQGTLKQKSGILNGYLFKDEKKNKVTIFQKEVPNSKFFKTAYRVIRETNGNSVVEVDLLTGRTHQIRACMAAIGHPLLGDTKYGYRRKNTDDVFPYQALYAYRVTFDFQGDNTILDYLNQKSFSVDTKKIWFLGDAVK